MIVGVIPTKQTVGTPVGVGVSVGKNKGILQ